MARFLVAFARNPRRDAAVAPVLEVCMYVRIISNVCVCVYVFVCENMYTRPPPPLLQKLTYLT